MLGPGKLVCVTLRLRVRGGFGSQIGRKGLQGTNSPAYFATFVSVEEEETSFDNITLGNVR